jgi:hypothetical protein
VTPQPEWVEGGAPLAGADTVSYRYSNMVDEDELHVQLAPAAGAAHFRTLKRGFDLHGSSWEAILMVLMHCERRSVPS